MVFLADECLYETMIDTDMEVAALTKLDENGKLLASNRVADSLFSKLRRMKRVLPRQAGFWRIRVKNDNIAYLEVLNDFSDDIHDTIASIEDEAKLVLDVLHKLNQGISFNDADLLANAQWIRLNTDFDPLVITEDRDLLTCGHLLSSFFGMTLGFLSCFEVLRLLELDGPLIDYCKHYELPEDLKNLHHSWSKLELEKGISNLLRKGKIACHPCPRRRDTTPLKKIKR